jgi:hypothetical protein
MKSKSPPCVPGFCNRTMAVRIFFILLLALVLNGCATTDYPGTKRIWVDRAVSPATSPRSLVMTGSLDWYSEEQSERYDVVLPKSTYHVVAQDQDYLYYQTQDNLTLLHTTDSGQNSRLFNGGIYISRNPDSKYPYGAYIDYKNGDKLLIFSFDSRFMGEEGSIWHYSGN